ncbi:MAG: sodium-dependent transporter [Ruminococcaceae bacterium]|nr:sodium-dependent transporter [Oscillospiraceae bacterium]
MQRERLGSRLGFILLSAGCAIGIGNVWKFPWMARENGGGIFVLIYLIFLIALGVPVMTMEFAVGRAAQKSPVKIYNELEPKGSKWHWHGYLAMAGNYILMMFYTCVSGWMLNYFVSTASGKFDGKNPQQIETAFDSMKADPVQQIVFMAIVVVIGFTVCSIGVQKGLERVTKYMMLALLAIMVVLAVNSIFLDGGKEGLTEYLIPDLTKINTPKKAITVITGAMTQSFFTLSLGIGSMAIFGSYIGKDRSLLGESVNIAFLDTFVAITSGLIIFPAAAAFNIDENLAGPSLIFVTLPNIFNNMPLGRLWGSLFFVFMSFAAFSTIFAVFENIVACTTDLFKVSRKKACLINTIVMFILSLPCALGYSLFKDFHPFGEDTFVLDLEDFIVSDIMLPIGALVFIIFCVTKYGWGWKNFKAEANSGKGLKVANWMRGYLTFVLPVIVIILLISRIASKF